MSWDGSGNFTRLYGSSGWTDDKNSAVFILSSRHDNHDNDIATGIQLAITKDNQSKPAADFKPNLDNSYDIGSLALGWKNMFSRTFRLINSGFMSILQVSTLTGNQTITAPDASGTLAVIASGTFTGTLTGMTGATTVTVSYTVIPNGYCFLHSIGGTGTSNTNQMTMTGVPAVCQPAAFLVVPCGQIADAGNLLMGAISISGGTITFAVDRTDSTANRVQMNSVSFTPSGAKGLGNGWCIGYPLV